jgi:DNA primase
MPVGPVRSEQPLATTNKTVRPFRIPKGMSDEEGAALIAREAEEKKVKAAARIQDMLEKKKERDAAKLATVNAARAKDGLAALTSLTEKSKTSKQESVMRKAKKVTKTAKAKTTNGSGNGKWTSADATITRLGKGDDYEPKKGTIAAKSWEACKAGTFGKFKEKGGNPAYLRWFANHGYVKVTG